MARRSAREVAMSVLYQKNYTQEYNLIALKDMVKEWELDDKDIPYIEDVISGYEHHSQQIDDLIRSYTKGWKFNRISKVDLSILRLSIYEILYRDDIPDRVSVNEAVELANKYGGEKTGSFVNGILGTILRNHDNFSDTEENTDTAIESIKPGIKKTEYDIS